MFLYSAAPNKFVELNLPVCSIPPFVDDPDPGHLHVTPQRKGLIKEAEATERHATNPHQLIWEGALRMQTGPADSITQEPVCV